VTIGLKDWRSNVSFFGKKTVLLCASLVLVSAFQNVHAKLKVGVTAGPHADIMAFLKEEGKKEGLEIEVIEFNDFILPNTALSEGDIDANSYQHEPFLKDQNETRGLKLASVAKTVLMPFGVYAEKLTDLAALPYGAKIAIPNDVTNGGRALRLLEKMGLLKWKPLSCPVSCPMWISL
jgi:D-methionine transport system substrate-binding protein